jgi:hypothetical protein
MTVHKSPNMHYKYMKVEALNLPREVKFNLPHFREVKSNLPQMREIK